MNRYYEKKFQWAIAIAMCLVSFFICAAFGALVAYNFIWIWLIFLLVPISYIFSVPFFKLIGYFIYLSPMLVVSKPSDKTYKLHDGTLLDFFIVMKKYGRVKLKKIILVYYLSGILDIIKKIENKTLPESVVITTSTYLFSNRTINKLGFDTLKVGDNEKLGFIISYLSLLIMRSLAYGRISFPKLKNIKIIQVTGVELMKNRDVINALYHRINANF